MSWNVTLDDVTDSVHRRARLLALVSIVGVVYSLLLALSQPQVYRSTEVIQIIRPTTTGDIYRRASAPESNDSLQYIAQRLMARRNLLEVIDAFNLFSEYPDLKADGLVARLRSVTKVEAVPVTSNPTSGESEISALSITVEMPTAFQAQLVAAEFGQRAIALNARSRIGRATEALAFFTAQEDALFAKVFVFESRNSAIRAGFAPITPDTTEINRANPGIELAVYERQLRQARDELGVMSARRIEAEIALRLEQGHQVERLTVIDPAPLPDTPLPGARKQIALFGSFLSAGLALVLAFVLERRTPVIRSAAQMQRAVGFAPVASIPYLDTTPPRLTRWQKAMAWLDGPQTTDGTAI